MRNHVHPKARSWGSHFYADAPKPIRVRPLGSEFFEIQVLPSFGSAHGLSISKIFRAQAIHQCRKEFWLDVRSEEGEYPRVIIE
jgi:tRNA-dihydrouridine synthase